MMESQTEVVALFVVADSRLPSDRSGATLTQMWNKYDEEKEFHRAVKFVSKDRCSDIVNQVPSGRGYELLRLLALRCDPVMPHLRSMLLSSIYGLANEKCKDFKATVARIAYIEKISNDMADQCGSRPPEEFLGDILYQSMDSSSISELVHYRI